MDILSPHFGLIAWTAFIGILVVAIVIVIAKYLSKK
jgi:hypothetical protein